MRRIIIKYAIGFIVFCSTFCLGGSVGISSNNQQVLKECELENLEPSVVEDIMYSEKINNQFEALVDSWGDSYPDYYAGAFIENREFYFLVTCDPDEVHDEVCSVTGNEDIHFRKVAYSYFELTGIQESVTSMIDVSKQNNEHLTKKVIGIGVDVKKNDVFVEMLNVCEEEKNELQNRLATFGPIRIVDRDEAYTEESTNVTAGTDHWVTNASLGGSCTISFCASRINGSTGATEFGFVTAGHAGNTYNTMSISGTNVGKIMWRKYGGNCDVSFVRMSDYPNSGYVRSNILSTFYTLNGYSSVGVVGTTYVMHGMASNVVSGTVDNTSFTYYNANNLQFTDHIRMQIAHQGGDSGAPLVKYSSATARILIGTETSGAGSYANFTKASNIMSSMNGSMY